jgi:hypothetical protein
MTTSSATTRKHQLRGALNRPRCVDSSVNTLYTRRQHRGALWPSTFATIGPSIARKLAAKRGQTMTQAVITALESELRRHGKRSLGQRLDEIAEELADKGNPTIARPVTEDEVEALWDNG